VLFTANYAFNYYVSIRNDFLSDSNTTEELIVNSQKAVFFTKEKGDPYVIQGILVYYEDYKNGVLTLGITNINDIPVKLISLQNEDSKYIYPFEENAFIKPSDPIVYRYFQINNVDKIFLANKLKIYINYTYDNGVIQQAPMFPFKLIDNKIFHDTAIRTKDNLAEFDFIAENDQYIYFDAKEVVINKPLFIPSGKELRVFAGQKINLINQAYIIARTSIQLEGSESNPIQIYTSDGSGRGIFISQASATSNISYVVFKGLDAPMSGVWALTGAVTFYESNVNIDHSRFENNLSEDGLNIIRSKFNVSNSFFDSTFSDALDVDFCTGVILNCVFENTGNDAVDISASKVKIFNTKMSFIGDKAISGGENSLIEISNIDISEAVIGIASKDLSNISGENISISNSKIGITLYEKKPEYGPATIDINNYTLKGQIDLDYLIQENSTLIIDGQMILPRSTAKESLLFDKMIIGEPIQ